MKKFVDKVKTYQMKQAGALNHNFNLLTKEQKEKVKISVLKYHQPVSIAIQQAYFFNKINCDDINEYMKINNMI
jgi:hypothetical protein